MREKASSNLSERIAFVVLMWVYMTLGAMLVLARINTMAKFRIPGTNKVFIRRDCLPPCFLSSPPRDNKPKAPIKDLSPRYRRPQPFMF